MALSATDLDVIAMNCIKADFQGIQSKFFALTNLEFIQIICSTVCQRTPLIQFLIVTRSNNATVTYQYRGICSSGGRYRHER